MKNPILKTKQMKIACPKCRRTYIRVIPEYDDAEYSICPHCTNIVLLPDKLREALASFSPILYLSPNCEPLHGADRLKEMNNVSKLISQMAIRGGRIDEIIDAVKYSMVCIDSNKCTDGAYIDVSKAYNDLHISQLFDKYASGTHSVMRS